MRDKLKELIQNNREDFDTHEPGDLWTKIDQGMKQHASGINSKNIQHMLKYGFGASALIVGTFLVVTSQKDKVVGKSQHVASKPVRVSRPVNTLTLTTNIVPVQETGKEEKKPQTISSIAELPRQTKDSIVSGALPETTDMEITDSVAEPAYSGRGNTLIASYGTSLSFKNNDSLKDDAYVHVDTLFKDVKRLEVNGESCHITVKAHPGNDVRMQGEIGGPAGDVLMFGMKSYKNKITTCRFEKKDSVLKVWIEPKDLKKRVRVTNDEKKTSHLDFEVPSKTEVIINNSSGNIGVYGIEGNVLNLETDFGHITAENIKTGLILRTSSGNISAKNITGTLTAKTSFGHQVLDDLTGDILLRSNSGNITVKHLKGNADVKSSFGHQKFENVTGDINSVSSSGNITIKELKGKADAKTSFGWQQYANVSGDIHATASSGNVEIDGSKGNLHLTTSFGHITGKNVLLLNNSEFRTSSGNIHMNFLNSMKELRFDLKASFGNLLVEKDHEKNRSDDSLVFGQGAILVKGVSSFGNQNYR